MMKRIWICLFLLVFPAISYGQENLQTIVDFKGEIVDSAGLAVSGVLPLEFRVYTDQKSKKPIASEKHFVSVVDGVYLVTLGEQSTIKSSKDKLMVAVYLDGKEIMPQRQEVETQRQIVAPESNVRETENVGQSAEDNYELKCPNGYAVTGIKGSKKEGIEGIRLICTKAI